MPKPISSVTSSTSWVATGKFSVSAGVMLKLTLPLTRAKPKKAARIKKPETAVKIKNFVEA